MNYELNQKQREYYNKHRDKIREQRKVQRSRSHEVRVLEGQKWRKENQQESLWRSAKNNAVSKGREFSIEVCDILIPEKCPYLGIPLTNIQGDGRVWTNASLDRKDSSKGYTKDNIQVISILANCMKQHATEEQLLAFAKGVERLHGSS